MYLLKQHFVKNVRIVDFSNEFHVEYHMHNAIQFVKDHYSSYHCIYVAVSIISCIICYDKYLLITRYVAGTLRTQLDT